MQAVSICRHLSHVVTGQLRHTWFSTGQSHLYHTQTFTLARPAHGIQEYILACSHCRPSKDFIVVVASLSETGRVRKKARWLALGFIMTLLGIFTVGFHYAATLDTPIPGILMALSCGPLFGYGLRFSLQSFWKGVQGARCLNPQQDQVEHSFI